MVALAVGALFCIVDGLCCNAETACSIAVVLRSTVKDILCSVALSVVAIEAATAAWRFKTAVGRRSMGMTTVPTAAAVLLAAALAAALVEFARLAAINC